MFKFCLLLLTAPCFAKDLSVLIDVSGTMGNYGNWQPHARELVASLIDGNPASADWKVEGDQAAARDFAAGAGDTIHVLRFGSTRSSVFPFFSPDIKISSAEGLTDLFPLLASDYKQSRTNKSLAIAVGSKLAASDGIARLIVVSDFLIDSSLTPDEQEFVNSFESMAQFESPAIYTWAENPHIQIKLLRVKNLPERQTAEHSSPPVSLRITGARLFDSPKRVLFSWELVGATADPTYSVTVQDPQSSTIVFSRSRFANSSLQWSDPPSGHFVWRVKATMPDNQQVSSASAPIVVPGEPLTPVLLALGILLSVGVGLWAYARRNRPSGNHAPPSKPKETSAWKA